MSAFSGRQNRGAKRALREYKRSEAQARQKDFDAAVVQTAQEQDITQAQARPVTAKSRRLAREAAGKVA